MPGRFGRRCSRSSRRLRRCVRFHEGECLGRDALLQFEGGASIASLAVLLGQGDEDAFVFAVKIDEGLDQFVKLLVACHQLHARAQFGERSGTQVRAGGFECVQGAPRGIRIAMRHRVVEIVDDSRRVFLEHLNQLLHNIG